MKRYLVAIEDGIQAATPEGPFKSEKARARRAFEIRTLHGLEWGIHALDINSRGEPEMWSYSGTASDILKGDDNE